MSYIKFGYASARNMFHAACRWLPAARDPAFPALLFFVLSFAGFVPRLRWVNLSWLISPARNHEFKKNAFYGII